MSNEIKHRVNQIVIALRNGYLQKGKQMAEELMLDLSDEKTAAQPQWNDPKENPVDIYEEIVWVKRASEPEPILAVANWQRPMNAHRFQDVWTAGDHEGLNVEYFSDVQGWLPCDPVSVQPDVANRQLLQELVKTQALMYIQANAMANLRYTKSEGDIDLADIVSALLTRIPAEFYPDNVSDALNGVIYYMRRASREEAGMEEPEWVKAFHDSMDGPR